MSKKQSLKLEWLKCTSEAKPELHWCRLEDLELPLKSKVGGVYVIWHGGAKPWTVRLGQGDISSRLAAHRKDSNILAYKKNGTLFVTWAAVQKSDRDGVEAYLEDSLDPRVGDVFPDADPIPVNLPWR